jgi:hypothetical protein
MVMQGREENRWLHQFTLYPSKGFGPEAQSKFAYRRERAERVGGPAYRRIGVSAYRRIGVSAPW